MSACGQGIKARRASNSRSRCGEWLVAGRSWQGPDGRDQISEVGHPFFSISLFGYGLSGGSVVRWKLDLV